MQIPLKVQVKIFTSNRRIKLFSATLWHEEKTDSIKYPFPVFDSGNICPIFTINPASDPRS